MAADPKVPTKMRLYYFNSRGRAELIRWILSYGKADWQDVRHTAEEWPKIKPTMPMAQVPVLEGEVDGVVKKLTQSATIVRACAKWLGLAGKTPPESLRADEAFEVIREMFEMNVKSIMEPDKARQEAMRKKMAEEIYPRNLSFLEEKLKTAGGKFIGGGDCFTYADLTIAWYLSEGRQVLPPALFDQLKSKFPLLFDLATRVEENPEIKAWLAKRPKTDH